MTASVVWISLSYLLAFLGKYEIAQELSQTVVTGVIAVMAPYFAKSLFETKWEKDLEFKRELMDKKEEEEVVVDLDDIVG